MITVRLLLMILAVICLALAAIGVVPPRGGNLMALGLTLWALAIIVG
jgi:hypothetical protein